MTTNAQPRGQRTWRHVERSDRHNSARQEYSLVRGLVAVVETIRSRQRRGAGWRCAEAVVACHVLFSVVREKLYGKRTSKWNRKWRHKYCIWSGGTSSMQLGDSSIDGHCWTLCGRRNSGRCVKILMRRISKRGSNPCYKYHFKQWIAFECSLDIYRETFRDTIPLKNLAIALRTTTNHVGIPKGKQRVGTEWKRQWRRWEHRIEARRDTAVLRGGELEERRRAPTEETPA